MNEYTYSSISQRLADWYKIHPEPKINQAVIHGCKDIPIIKEIVKELCHARLKHPSPWQTNPDFNIFEKVGVMAVEAGEALKAASKLQYQNGNGSIEDYENGKATCENLKTELYQTAGLCLRILLDMEEHEYKG